MTRESTNFLLSCKQPQELLLQITHLRTVLADIEKSLQEEHLSRCIFPRIQGAHEIGLAIHQLSTRRIGALVAIEQEMSLENYAQSGTLLNAELSPTLLLSLLYPGNPLHDGAVIVRGSSILAAGCVLPLSADHALFKPRGLGMRHRAGVGLSEVSDAIVFIVSEETGAISMATGGQLLVIDSGYSQRDAYRPKADMLASGGLGRMNGVEDQERLIH